MSSTLSIAIEEETVNVFVILSKNLQSSVCNIMTYVLNGEQKQDVVSTSLYTFVCVVCFKMKFHLMKDLFRKLVL